MKTNKIIIVSLLSLVLIISVILYLLFYVLFPKPQVTSLVTDSTLAFINLHKLDETVSKIERSEFVKKFVKSKLWQDIQSSETWQEVLQQIDYLKESIGLNRNMLMKLIGKNVVLAITSNNSERNLILISELGLATRVVLQIQELIKYTDAYEFTKEEYKGIKLVTAILPERTVYYGFIGRIGILSNNSSAIKDVIDLYRKKSINKFSRMFADILPSNTYVYINTQRSEEISDILKSYNININLSAINIVKSSYAWVGMVNDQNGGLKIDSLIFYKDGSIQTDTSGNDKENHVLPIPGKNLILSVHEKQDPNYLFDFLGKYLIPQISLIRNELGNLFTSSIAEAIVKPDIREFRMIPPLIMILHVRNRTIAETTLNNFMIFIKKQYPNSKIEEIDYENKKIVYITSFPEFLLPIGMGYVLLENNLFVMSTELYTLKDVIDISNGKKRSFTDDKEYQNVMKSFSEKSDNKAFINLKAVIPIIDQIAKLYIWQTKLLGKRNYEKRVNVITENIIILQDWNYFGLSFKRYGDRAKLNLVLIK